MPFDAFQVSPDQYSGDERLQVNRQAFTNKENELGQSAENVLDEVDKKLEEMHDFIDSNESGLSRKEFKMAHVAIEHQLEKRIPNKFKNAYEATDSWEDAAELIGTNILATLDSFVNTQLKETVKTVDSEHWIGDYSLANVRETMKAVDPTIKPNEWRAIQAQVTPELYAAKQERMNGAMNFAEMVAGSGAVGKAADTRDSKIH